MKFQELEDREKAKGVELVFVLVDGFLLYYDPVSPFSLPTSSL